MYKQIVLLLIVLFIDQLQSKAVVTLIIGNLKIPENIMKKLNFCTSQIYDDCELMFDICVSSQKSCDLYRTTKYISIDGIIDHQEIMKMAKPENIHISIKVYGPKTDNYRESLGYFQKSVMIQKLKTIYYLKVPENFAVNIMSKVNVKCQDYYYGRDCTSYCKTDFRTFRCDQITGQKICLLNCDKRFTCVFKKTGFVCDCNDEWYGIGCAFNKKASPPSITNTTYFPIGNSTPIITLEKLPTLSLIVIIIICIPILITCSIIVIVIMIKKLGKRKRKPVVTLPFTSEVNTNTPMLVNDRLSLIHMSSNKSGTNIDNNGYLPMNSLKSKDSIISVRQLPSIPLKIEDNDSVYEQPLPIDNENGLYAVETYMTVEDDYEYELPKDLEK